MAVSVTEILKLVLATRLSFRWWGEQRRMEDATKNTMAAAVEADPDSITAGKRIYNTRLEVNGEKPLLNIQKFKGEIKEYWERVTLPHPETGVRLLPKDKVLDFNARMEGFQTTLTMLSLAVQEARTAIVDEAQSRLKGAFDPGNYPADLSQLFAFEISYPSLSAPGDLPPALYEQEKQKIESKLQEAVRMTTDAFTSEFAWLVSHLHERLEPGPDGQPKAFKEASLKNLADFFDRFKTLNIGGMDDLEKLVTEAKELVAGVSAKGLRTPGSANIRQSIAEGLAKIEEKITPLIINQPRRKILRPSQQPQPSPVQEAIPA